MKVHHVEVHIVNFIRLPIGEPLRSWCSPGELPPEWPANRADHAGSDANSKSDSKMQRLLISPLLSQNVSYQHVSSRKTFNIELSIFAFAFYPDLP